MCPSELGFIAWSGYPPTKIYVSIMEYSALEATTHTSTGMHIRWRPIRSLVSENSLCASWGGGGLCGPAMCGNEGLLGLVSTHICRLHRFSS